ncbi:DUF2787 domain-containing protein [Photobacterium profundum]|uniref:DUF2787 family protein n=1 Tax=Photobacterium profundum TaxID=74109 RepID=UPI003D11493E
MIEQEYGEITLSNTFHRNLEKLLRNHSIPIDASKLVINCRALNYYRDQRGAHPVEIQLKKENGKWRVIFIASFSYPSEQHSSVEVELYFHLINNWFYQPDAGGRCNLNHPQVKALFTTWISAFCQQLTSQRFDDISITLIQ